QNYGVPNGAPIQGSDGFLYGTTSTGYHPLPPNPSGAAIYRLSTNGSGLSVLASFTNLTDAGGLNGGLVEGTDGDFYGTIGGVVINNITYYGWIFRVSTNGSLTEVFSFNSVDGYGTAPPLPKASDGHFS